MDKGLDKVGPDRGRHAPPQSVGSRPPPVRVIAVISVAMLGGQSAADYYLQRAADCEPAGYYIGEVELPGRWCGHGAAALALDGPVTGGAAHVFAGLLDGRLPDGTVVARPVLRADGRRLLPAGPLVTELRRAAVDAGVDVAQLVIGTRLVGVVTNLVNRHDNAVGRRAVLLDVRVVADVAAAAGLNPHVLYPADASRGGFAGASRHGGAQVDVRRSGLDVVVSAPKSVSVLYALADLPTAATVAAAHERAVAEALGYLERHTTHGLRGHQGGDSRARRIRTDGFVAAAFTHHTSRADDPQLHTHIVIANLLRGEDGRWSSVDSRAVYRHARTAGCVYQAVLRGELTRTLGVDWGPVRKGVAEIVGIPRPLLLQFSTRRTAIERELDRTGSTGRRAAQRAAYRTRTVKTHLPAETLRERWTEATRALGADPKRIVAETVHRRRSPALPVAGVVAAQLFGPSGLTRAATSFDRRDVIQALTETLPAGLSISGVQLEAAADRMLRNPDAVRLLQPDEPDEDGRWSTAELLATEALALSYTGQPTTVPAYGADDATALVSASTLSAEQRHLVSELLCSADLIDVVVGPAGCGKTAALRVAARGWEQTGAPVIGCAVAAVTARRLEAATGIPASSIARLLADLGRIDPRTGQPAGLAPRSVVVVDEASMVGTRQLAALAGHVARAGGKLVLVGDPAQLSEIDAGGLFAALARLARPLTAN